MRLDLTSLEKSIVALDRALSGTERSEAFAGYDESLRETLRSGVIQCFEVAYEQSWKTMKRWLETNVAPDAADGVSRRELYRLAAEQKLLEDVAAWMRFHQVRNLTSHTYDAAAAEEAYTAAVAFLPFARELLARVAERND